MRPGQKLVLALFSEKNGRTIPGLSWLRRTKVTFKRTFFITTMNWPAVAKWIKVLPSQKVRGLCSRSVGHFGDRWQLVFTQLDNTPDLMRPLCGCTSLQVSESCLPVTAPFLADPSGSGTCHFHCTNAWSISLTGLMRKHAAQAFRTYSTDGAGQFWPQNLDRHTNLNKIPKGQV